MSARHRKKKSFWKTLIILLILGGGGLRWLAVFFSKKKNDSQSAAPITASVTRGTIENVVTATGVLEPSQFVDLGAQVSGTLEKIFFEIGDTVKRGDLMAQIDPALFEARVQQDEASLQNLKAQLASREASFKLARQRHERNQGLLKSKAVSEQSAQESEAEYAQAIANLDALKAQIKQAEATLAASQANLGYTKIYAPMDGTVVNIIAREGQTLNANQTTPNLMRLANLAVMTVQAKVSEADITKIQPDMEAYFTTLGNLEKKYYGRVTQIRPTPDATNAPVFYNVLFNVDNSDGDLMPLMTAQVFFVLSKTENALMIPTTALEYAHARRAKDRQNRPGGAPSPSDPRPTRAESPDPSSPEKNAVELYTLKNGEPSPTPVQIGISNRLSVEILSGLSEGQEVVIGPIEKEQRGIRPRITWR